MTPIRHLGIAAVAFTVLLSLQAGPVAADVDQIGFDEIVPCPSSRTLNPGIAGTPSGTKVEAVSPAHPVDWYRTGRPAEQIIVLMPVDGDADLFVWDGCGGALACHSINGGTHPDICSAGPRQRVEVRHFGHPIQGFAVHYSVTAVSPGG